MRPIGVTWFNVFIIYLIAVGFTIPMQFQNQYITYLLKYDLGVPDSDAPDKIATVTMTQSTLSLFWQFFIGAIFDTYGRKKPLLLSFFLLALE